MGRVRAVPHLWELYPGICLTNEGKARKNLRRKSLFKVSYFCPILGKFAFSRQILVKVPQFHVVLNIWLVNVMFLCPTALIHLFWVLFYPFVLLQCPTTTAQKYPNIQFNPLNAELNPICHFLALFGTHHIFHVSR
jgi:hypothetical protein